MVDIMNDKPDGELPPDVAKALSDARVPMAPPPAVEQKTIAALRERGLVHPRGRRALMAWAAVAAALAVLAGWLAIQKTTAPVVGPRFVLLLYAGSDPIAGTADARRTEYGAWARDLASRGVQVSGEELSEESAALGASNGSAAGGEALPRGFFVIQADDLAAAQRIASTCPHLRYGGRIVIKRVVS